MPSRHILLSGRVDSCGVAVQFWPIGTRGRRSSAELQVSQDRMVSLQGRSSTQGDCGTSVCW